jgi:DNA-binding MarR family transcriptional regulator
MAAASDLDAIAADLRLALGRLSRRVRQRDGGLPIARLAVLGRLDRDGALTTSELAAGDRVRPQSMARTVGELVAAGHVDVRPHPTDGRKALVGLTEAGRLALEEERRGRASWLAGAMESELTASEREQLADAVPLLHRLADRPA